MSESRICPNCRATVAAEAPEGFCPACAQRAALDSGAGAEAPTLAGSEPRSAPLATEELARRLPELEAFELLGQGGMGTVFRARHRQLDRPVAVKVLAPTARGRSGFAERFAREARTMAQLDHPGLVTIYDFGHRDGLYYLIMEFVDGFNLRQLMETGSLEPHEAIAMVPPICEALQYAHDRGVVHRDIKPENILVDRSGSIKIADFGLAKLVEQTTGPRLTQTELVMGTLNYMAPEQMGSPGQVDHRADIYALGVVFYELLTGELPVGRYAAPSQKAEIDARLDDVVLRTLERDPSLRYQRSSDLKSDIESLVSGSASRAVPPGTSPSREAPKYEYRSKTTLFGLPLVHVVDGGKKMGVACGVIAIGQVAVGVVAIGLLSFGGMTFGLIGGIGLLAFASLAVGLLTAVGSIAVGPFAFGAIAVGVVAVGAMPISMLTPTSAAKGLGWLTMAFGGAVTTVVAGYAWVKDRVSHRSA